MKKQCVIVAFHPNVKDPTIPERDYYHPQCAIESGHLSPEELRDVRVGIALTKSRQDIYFSGEQRVGLYGYRGEAVHVTTLYTYTTLDKENAPGADCAGCGVCVLAARRGQATAASSNYYQIPRGDVR